MSGESSISSIGSSIESSGKSSRASENAYRSASATLDRGRAARPGLNPGGVDSVFIAGKDSASWVSM
jgi:hypothetical protein